MTLTLPEIETAINKMLNVFLTAPSGSLDYSFKNVPENVIREFAEKKKLKVLEPDQTGPAYCSYLRFYRGRPFKINLMGSVTETIYKQKAPVGAEA